MEKFIEDFCEFRTWLYDCLDCGDNPTIGDVINKFEELKLNQAF